MKLDQQTLVHEKIQAGNTRFIGKTILHTAPHHDDILLGYHTYAMQLFPGNTNHILYATSGYNGVRDEYIAKMIRGLDELVVATAMSMTYEQILHQFAQAYVVPAHKEMLLLTQYMIIQFIADIFGCRTHEAIVDRLNLLTVYFSSKNQGLHEIELVQELKGRIRESEADRKWMICKGSLENIKHFRASFYQASEQTFQQVLQDDVHRLSTYLDAIKPDIITIAVDPYDIGPKNHFTTLQLITEALQQSDHNDVEILGYRNVWSNFELQEASLIIPVTQHNIDAMKSIFVNCFATQKTTIFMGTDIDGNFADQAEQLQKIQLEQVQQVCASKATAQLVGQEHVGAIFIKKLMMPELLSLCSNI